MKADCSRNKLSMIDAAAAAAAAIAIVQLQRTAFMSSSESSIGDGTLAPTDSNLATLAFLVRKMASADNAGAQIQEIRAEWLSFWQLRWE